MRQFYTVKIVAEVEFNEYVRADNANHAIKRAKENLKDYARDECLGFKRPRVISVKGQHEDTHRGCRS